MLRVRIARAAVILILEQTASVDLRQATANCIFVLRFLCRQLCSIRSVAQPAPRLHEDVLKVEWGPQINTGPGLEKPDVSSAKARMKPLPFRSGRRYLQVFRGCFSGSCNGQQAHIRGSAASFQLPKPSSCDCAVDAMQLPIISRDRSFGHLGQQRSEFCNPGNTGAVVKLYILGRSP